MLKASTVKYVLATLSLTTVLGFSSAAMASQTVGSFQLYGGTTSDTGDGFCMAMYGTQPIVGNCCVNNGTICTPSNGNYGGAAWQINSNGLINYIDFQGGEGNCLKASSSSAVTIAACNSSDATQKWFFYDGHLCSQYWTASCIDATGSSWGYNVVLTDVGYNQSQIVLPLNISTYLQNGDVTSDCMNVWGGNVNTYDETVGIYSCSGIPYNEWFAFEPISTQYYHAQMFAQTSNGTNALCVTQDDYYGLLALCSPGYNGPGETSYSYYPGDYASRLGGAYGGLGYVVEANPNNSPYIQMMAPSYTNPDALAQEWHMYMVGFPTTY